MKPRALITLVAILAAGAFAPRPAWANREDLQLWRLGNPGTYPNANDRFRLLMVDLALAVTPTPMQTPATEGRIGGGFDLGARYAQVHADATIAPKSGKASDCPPGNSGCKIWVNEGTAPGMSPVHQPDSALLMPVLQVRKGLPFSFEADAKVQYVSYSNMLAVTAGFRWALNEGFDYLPDVSIGGQGTRMLGTPGFGLTTAALDITVGKTFGVDGMLTLAPYVGWQHIWVSATSGVIDFNPGQENPANPTVDDNVFNDVVMGKNGYDRFFLGLRFNTAYFALAGEATYQPGYLGQSAQFIFEGKIGVMY